MKKIKFGTDGWRAIIAEEFTTENVARVAFATAKWVKSISNEPSIAIGHDCRFGGSLFVETTINILCNEGIKVYAHKGICSTPMLSLACKNYNTTAGIVITASHNPPSYNGFKLKSNFGGPTIPSDIALVESFIPDTIEIPKIPLEQLVKEQKLTYVDLETDYIKHVEANFNMNAIRNSGMLFGYDAMYGAGQNVARKLLPNNLVYLHCEYNPSFYGQAPEPIHKNLLEFSELMKKTPELEFGFANDGDADRIGCYDGNGNFIDSHHILLLLIHYMHHYKKEMGKVVVSFTVSNKIKKLCDAYNIPCEVTPVGFKYICEIMVNEDVLVGGEESGGLAIKGHIPERDGIWIALVLMEFMAKTGKNITELINEVYDVVGAFDYDRYDLHISEEIKQNVIKNCNEDNYKNFGKYNVLRRETIDGWKYFLNDEDWLMIRASGTEPVLRVYAQSNSRDAVIDILEDTKKTLLGE
ncbi:MAG: phosphoglucomutase/phosphomannomutase family protein [Sphingobacteriales bacterium]|nr:MAG: phosphoglucomutase/phosphomannomutase family protein [Sphingobacteriales bacterium]